MNIPFARLGIPAPLRKSVGPDANRSAKIAVAKGCSELPFRIVDFFTPVFGIFHEIQVQKNYTHAATK